MRRGAATMKAAQEYAAFMYYYDNPGPWAGFAGRRSSARRDVGPELVAHGRKHVKHGFNFFKHPARLAARIR